jgi:hypothetical protein
MRLEPLCAMDLEYVGGFHLATPYGSESGAGWGVGVGQVTGERLSGTAQWSNHPERRGDGTMLPNARGVITAEDGAEILFSLAGRTVWLDRDGEHVGRQLLMTLFESGHERYSWLNNTVCVAEGVIDPERLTVHLEVDLCLSGLI